MKAALVTGASSGIGKALAEVLALHKHNLILVARNKEKLESLKIDLNSKYAIDVIIIIKDLSKPNAAKELYKEIKKENISIEILINNAGLGAFGEFSKSSWEREYETLQVNIVALTQLTKLYLPEMINERRGKILNMASTAAFQPGPLMSIYFASKAFVLSFSEALSFETKGTGVSVTALCPGATKSEFHKAAKMESSKLIEGNIPTSMEVAKYGYKAMMSGKTVAIHGFMNKLLTFAVRLLPRDVVTFLAKKVVELK